MKKKLLIIIHHFYRGGAERTAAKLTELLADEFDIHIVTFFDETEFEYSFQPVGKLTCLGQQPAKNIFHQIKNTYARVKFLRKYKRQHSIKLSLSFLFSADIANILSKNDDRIFVSLRTFLSKTKQGKLTRFLTKKYYRKADIIIGQNTRAIDDAVQNFNIERSKTKVISNFFDASKILQLRDQPLKGWESTTQFTKFINVGRLSYPKGQWHLLRIFKGVLNESPKSRLVLIGSGELKDFLLDYASELNLRVQDLSEAPDKVPNFEDFDVALIGFAKNPFQYLKLCEVFLFTSIHEGFPNALAEAMICGCTVFSTDCQTGPKELIAPQVEKIERYPMKTKRGILFPEFEGEKIAATAPLLSAEKLWIDSLTDYIKSPERYIDLGRQAHHRMRSFDKQIIKQNWLEILD